MKHKTIRYFALPLVVLGLILPLSQAQAVIPLVGAGIAAAVVYIGGWVLQAVSLATAGCVSLATGLIHWVLYSIDYAYTSGGIVDIGWPIVRDLTNMLFVIILVFIGLSTALRLGGSGTQKMLVSLVGIALLVNFTPVIAGFIVDASNIVMNFFVEGLSPGSYFEAHLAAQRSIMPASIWEALNPFKNIEHLLGSLILIVLDIIAFLIFMAFALLFLTRYVAIWVLVILSPLAFACYILPQTRSIFGQWWNQFIQWCIIGIVAAFFLYLGTQLLGALEEMSTPSSGEFVGPMQIMTNLMPMVTVIIFYIIGLCMAVSTSAMGASQIISFGKKAGKTVGRASLGLARGVPAISKAETAARKKLEMVPLVGRALGGPGAFSADLDKERKRAGKNLETMNSDDIRKVMKMAPLTRDDRLRRARGIELLAEKNQIKDADKRYHEEAIRLGVPSGDVYKKMPHWDSDVRKRVEGMDVEDFRKNVRPEALRHMGVFEAMDLRKAVDLGEKGTRSQKDALHHFAVNNSASIIGKITTLRKTGGSANIAEANKLEKIWFETGGGLNYTT